HDPFALPGRGGARAHGLRGPDGRGGAAVRGTRPREGRPGTGGGGGRRARRREIAPVSRVHALPSHPGLLRHREHLGVLWQGVGVNRLLIRESQTQPVVVVFEDLHWIDAETQTLVYALSGVCPRRAY